MDQTAVSPDEHGYWFAHQLAIGMPRLFSEVPIQVWKYPLFLAGVFARNSLVSICVVQLLTPKCSAFVLGKLLVQMIAGVSVAR
jgi:hypothetical protein